jgi:hypothetical protein
MTVPENVEVERLRAEVARLEAARRGRAARAGRWVGAVAILVVALLLGIASIAAVFARNQLLDTDRYVATVAPLARDPVVQDAVANRLTQEVVTHVDLEGLARQATAWLQTQGAPPAVNQLVPPAVNGVESFVHSQVRRLVGTEQFAAAWDAANRVAHDDLRAVLTGGSSGAVASSGTDITVDLGVVLETVKQRLVAAGFALAGRIPRVSVPFTVYSSPDLPKIRTYVTWLDRAATWLPWVALALLAAAVVVAPDRRRGLLLTGLFVALGLLLARGGIAIARDYYLDRLPASVQSPEAGAGGATPPGVPCPGRDGRRPGPGGAAAGPHPRRGTAVPALRRARGRLPGRPGPGPQPERHGGALAGGGRARGDRRRRDPRAPPEGRRHPGDRLAGRGLAAPAVRVLGAAEGASHRAVDAVNAPSVPPM